MQKGKIMSEHYKKVCLEIEYNELYTNPDVIRSQIRLGAGIKYIKEKI